MNVGLPRLKTKHMSVVLTHTENKPYECSFTHTEDKPYGRRLPILIINLMNVGLSILRISCMN